MTRPSVLTLLLGLSILPVGAWLLGNIESSHWWSPPASVPLFFFAFITHPAFAIAALPFLFWLWASGLFRTSTFIPRSTVLVVVVAFALSGVSYLTHPDDLLPTDPFANVAVFLLLSALVGLSRWRPSFAVHAAFRWLAFVWCLSYALPLHTFPF
jgi:hypothetical protein